MAHPGDEKPIDRTHVKDPSEVSGWSDPEHPNRMQDFSDISRHKERNAEFEDKGRSTHEPRGRPPGKKE